MKSEDLKNLGVKKGVSRLWLGVAAAVGAATAYLADPERGNARRQAAVQQLSGAAQAAADRTSRWRRLVGARLSREAQPQPPTQVTLPSEPGPPPAVPARTTNASKPPPPSAELKKPSV